MEKTKHDFKRPPTVKLPETA
ncbi:MAG: hypothetical protein K0R47_4983, partial [Brevibacillus sp.]|nr:hypothetical protein [Brevibacillus sp.]